jgi:hypothetical protein
MANETSSTTAQVRNIRLVPSDTVNRDHTVSSLDLTQQSEGESSAAAASENDGSNSG